ncbi:DNA gyrase inhibitor YacG [Methylobacterium oxalidis]|uniref:DNA gyrase inhibitor YacG n=1 Tax=Methylobacterium oxalidis TaxID=944322 RepID=A0A512J175_9HYPH|nr:DNA gyrase inhibitor YacG [Methylobacterium oxalidis]GEP03704.1 DNA gyrase inhibitor YacG [Methylobacterium oxalidis]GJE33690.1 DNA gyrase inhibitor YacG [Methylobacterium oxalidis]GLS62288.1 DNA gyrase inhibitor YacG [Methylobacterium oxalidis]
MSAASEKAAPCPICGRPSEPAVAPFCSARCADIDLGRWLSDRYVIPTDDEEESEPPQKRSE